MNIKKQYVYEDAESGLAVVDIIQFLLEVKNKLGSSDTKVKLALKYGADNDYNFTGFSEVCSWRGSYGEPCLVAGMNHNIEQLLDHLDGIPSGTVYYGYKGGDYTYSGYEHLNVEVCHSSYTGEGYIRRLIYTPEEDEVVLYCTKYNV